MDNLLFVLIGICVFGITFLVKTPVKNVTRYLAYRKVEERGEEYCYARYRKLNLVILLVVLLLSVTLNLMFCVILGNHHKLCFALKATMVAICLYSVYEQLFGPVKEKSGI